jgi:hypothetical protein
MIKAPFVRKTYTQAFYKALSEGNYKKINTGLAAIVDL